LLDTGVLRNPGRKRRKVVEIRRYFVYMWMSDLGSRILSPA